MCTFTNVIISWSSSVIFQFVYNLNGLFVNLQLQEYFSSTLQQMQLGFIRCGLGPQSSEHGQEQQPNLSLGHCGKNVGPLRYLKCYILRYTSSAFFVFPNTKVAKIVPLPLLVTCIYLEISSLFSALLSLCIMSALQCSGMSLFWHIESFQ